MAHSTTALLHIVIHFLYNLTIKLKFKFVKLHHEKSAGYQ